MKYSIIIPTLNEELYLGKLLNCLVGQTYKDFEVIVVDGKSEDKTREVALEFKNRLDIRFIESDERNVGYQRNLGVKNSRCDEIFFLDADGIIAPDFIKKVNKYIVSRKPDMLTAWISPISKNLIDHGMFFAYNVFSSSVLKNSRPAGNGAFCYMKKSVFEILGGFDTKLAYAEDTDLIVRAYNKGYKYEIIRDPVLRTSARRLEKEGRLKFVTTILKNNIYYSLVGPIYDPNFANYTMRGGSWYAEESEEGKKKKRFKDRLKIVRTLQYKLDPKKWLEFFKDF